MSLDINADIEKAVRDSQKSSSDSKIKKHDENSKYEEVSSWEAAFEIAPHYPQTTLWWFRILKELEVWGFVLCRKESK